MISNTKIDSHRFSQRFVLIMHTYYPAARSACGFLRSTYQKSACLTASAPKIQILYFFSPHHLINYTGVALDNLHNLRRYVLIHIIRHRQTVIAVEIHLHRRIHSLQQALLVNACQHKAALIQRLRTLLSSPDSYAAPLPSESRSHRYAPSAGLYPPNNDARAQSTPYSRQR